MALLTHTIPSLGYEVKNQSLELYFDHDTGNLTLVWVSYAKYHVNDICVSRLERSNRIYVFDAIQELF